jgi:urease accessory protein
MGTNVQAGRAIERQTFVANRATGAVGLEVAIRDGATRRIRVGESGSLRLRCPGPAGPVLEAVSINTAGGIAGGDRFRFDVKVGEGASLTLTSASAEKVYRSLGDDAEIAVRLDVGPRARLVWLPRETILFDAARLSRTIDVDVAADADLLFAEAVVFGRHDMGETVQGGRISDRWRVRHAGRLVYAESLRLDGEIAARLDRAAVAAGGAAMATLLLMPADDDVVAALRTIEGLRGEVGVSSFNGLTTARFVAADGESLRHDLTAALRLALAGPLPRLWLN